MTTFPEFPKLDQQACPFQPVTGGCAFGAKYRVALIISVKFPVFGEMFRQSPVATGGMFCDDQLLLFFL